MPLLWGVSEVPVSCLLTDVVWYCRVPGQPRSLDPRPAAEVLPGAGCVLQPFPRPGCQWRKGLWAGRDTGDTSAVPGAPWLSLTSPSPPLLRQVSAAIRQPSAASCPQRWGLSRGRGRVWVRVLNNAGGCGSGTAPQLLRASQSPEPGPGASARRVAMLPCESSTALGIRERRIKAVPNVCPFFSSTAMPMGVVQCKKFGTEFTSIYLCFLELGPGPVLF